MTPQLNELTSENTMASYDKGASSYAMDCTPRIGQNMLE